MASSNHSRARCRATIPALCALGAGGTALVAAGAAIAAVPYDATAPINLQAASSDFDYRNNTLLFRRVEITQGDLRVEALEAHATGLNFENSQWHLVGEVRITVPDGKLTADEATVAFQNNAIASAKAHGAPARFEQRLEDSGQLAKGRGRTIDYDVRNGTVRLSGDAWLTDGQSEILGNTLVYDIARQRVAANPGQTEPGGVRITIKPPEKQAPKSPKSPAPQAPAPNEPGPGR
jgi:lipopolysaccharide transport protein LptA